MQIKFSKKIKKVLSGFLISALIVFLILVFGSTQSSFLPESLEESIIGKTQRNGAEALENIFYDLDKSNIRTDAIPAMQRLLSILKKYPELTLQIKSHTDSRASVNYNLQLSKRRAQSVIDWLTSNGIEKSRISANYFGKRMLVNDCGDNVGCDEDVHQINRRSEFYLFHNNKNITLDCGS